MESQKVNNFYLSNLPSGSQNSKRDSVPVSQASNPRLDDYFVNMQS